MLHKLRIQFIALNLVLAFLVLFSAFSTVCYMDYQKRTKELFDVLSFTLNQALNPTIDQIDTTIRLQKNSSSSASVTTLTVLGEVSSPVGGNAGEGGTGDAGSGADGASAGSASSTSLTQDSQSANLSSAGTNSSGATQSGATNPVRTNTHNLEIGGGGGNSNEAQIPVAVYLAKPDGAYTALGEFASASIQHSVLVKANAEVLASKASTGELPDVGLYYEYRQTSNGTLIAYADTSNVNVWHQLAITLALVGLVILLAFLLITIFFSWWAFKPVERAWSQQTQFVADASHELKTPLTVILANMAILRSDPEATISEQSQWVESTQTEAERMQELVNDMLEMARPENVAAAAAGALFEALDFTDIVEGEVLQFESVAFDKGVTLESSLQSEIYVEGDAARLQRLVSTLIDNACKYADAGGQVNVELEVLDKSIVELRVNNTGSCIAAEDLPYVFDRFYRADKARTSGKGGFGLGLAIAYSIAVEHMGDITVTSSEDAGTTFTVALPLCAAPVLS